MANGTLTNESKRSTGGPRCEPYLYVVLDCAQPLAPSTRHALGDVDVVLVGRRERRSSTNETVAGERRLSLGLADRWMSSNHARLQRVMGKWLVEDQQSKNGTRVGGQGVERTELRDGDVVEVGRTFLLFRSEQLSVGAPPADPGTLLPELQAELERLRAVAPKNVPVLISGETGTGKELAARAAHLASRRSGPFVPVNCGALPRDLVASELFGHTKGAFTGALENRPGLVRSAHGGTLFLDEIGELPLEAQPALLRALQEREVVPVGATRAVPVDIQLVAATHQDLEALVEENRFRADLLARLSGFSLSLPPLRERREDLGLLVAALLRRAGQENATLSLEAARALFGYGWPMNVRELEKALQVSAALAAGKPIEPAHLPETVRAPRPAQAKRDDDSDLRERLVAALRQHRGNVSAVARELGKARMQVQRWLKRFGLDPASFH